MKEEHHEQAKRLLDARAVEGVPRADQEWLDTHLEACAGCTAYAESVGRTIAALRLLPVDLGPAVVEAARARVRLRAHELREHQNRMKALGMACGLSWALGVVSAPLLWWALEWIGERIAVPKPVWVVAFAFTWIVPATLVAAALTWRRSARAAEDGHMMIEPR